MRTTLCHHCARLAFEDGECKACGFTGRCPYCSEPVEPRGPHAQYHDGPCAAEASAEREADLWN